MDKRSSVALAVLCAAGAAAAQDSVTLFGNVDVSVTRGKGSLSSKTQLANSGMSSALFGLRGTEQLGGGMAAGFWLESGFNPDDGSGLVTNTNNQVQPAAPGASGLTFNRRSTLSIGGRWGELRLGRDYVPQYWNLGYYDPFGAFGIGVNQMRNAMPPLALGGLSGVALRGSNSIGYAWNHGFNAQLAAGGQGFHFFVQHYLGENASNVANKNDGTGNGMRLGYNAGALSTAIAVSRTEFASGDMRQNNAGLSYDFGVARVMAEYASDALGAVKGSGYLIGVTVPVGAANLRAAYSRYHTNATGRPESSKLSIGGIYNFSKRTSIYATVAHLSNGGSANFALAGSTTAAGKNSTGFEAGIRHSF